MKWGRWKHEQDSTRFGGCAHTGAGDRPENHPELALPIHLTRPATRDVFKSLWPMALRALVGPSRCLLRRQPYSIPGSAQGHVGPVKSKLFPDFFQH